MRDDICIFLGLKTDSKTALEFPSIGNHCHKARPVSPVNTKHQEKYCLTANHIECPVYKRAGVQRIPSRVTADRGFLQRNRFLMGVIILAVVFAGVAVVAVLMNNDPGLIGGPTTMAAALSTDPAPTLTPTPTPTPSLIPTPVHTETAEGAFRPFQPTVDLTRVACPKPTGWGIYYLKQNDTMFRLSQFYGIPYDVFLIVNCMDAKSIVTVGERIYVPLATLTPTPTLTLTPTVTRTRRPYVPPTKTPEPDNSGPTAPPPTAPP